MYLIVLYEFVDFLESLKYVQFIEFFQWRVNVVCFSAKNQNTQIKQVGAFKFLPMHQRTTML